MYSPCDSFIIFFLLAIIFKTPLKESILCSFKMQKSEKFRTWTAKLIHLTGRYLTCTKPLIFHVFSCQSRISIVPNKHITHISPWGVLSNGYEDAGKQTRWWKTSIKNQTRLLILQKTKMLETQISSASKIINEKEKKEEVADWRVGGRRGEAAIVFRDRIKLAVAYATSAGKYLFTLLSSCENKLPADSAILCLKVMKFITSSLN